MISPVIHFKEIIDALLKWVREDFNAFENEQDTWLYQFVHYCEVGPGQETAKYYDMVKEIFLRTNEKRNQLHTVLEYPKDTTLLPAIVLREPSRTDGTSNVIGGWTATQITTENGSKIDIFRDSKAFNYDLMCVAANYTESLLISEVLYGLLVGAYNTLALQYERLSYSMREILVNPDFNPYPVMIRTVTVSLQQSNFIPSIEREVPLDKVKFQYILYAK